jgi:hypothetical protein
MKTKLLLLTLALGASTCLLTSQVINQRPEGQGAPGRDGGPGAVRLLPPRAQEQLNLTADQQKQVAYLETQLQRQLDYILTPQQRQKLRQMRPPQPEGAPGGPGESGGPSGPPGNPGSLGGQRPPMPVIEALDLNKDGVIDAAEIAKASESLKKLDKNRDGRITSDEFLPQRPAGAVGPEGPGAERRRL